MINTAGFIAPTIKTDFVLKNTKGEIKTEIYKGENNLYGGIIFVDDDPLYSTGPIFPLYEYAKKMIDFIIDVCKEKRTIN